MCGLLQHGALGPQHSGAFTVAALISPKMNIFWGSFFCVFAVCGKNNWGAVLSSSKANFFSAAVLSSP